MIDYGGVIAIIFFYLLILAVGVWAGRKTGDTVGEQTQEVMLAGRNIGTMVGIFTMTGKFIFWHFFCKWSRNFSDLYWKTSVFTSSKNPNKKIPNENWNIYYIFLQIFLLL